MRVPSLRASFGLFILINLWHLVPHQQLPAPLFVPHTWPHTHTHMRTHACAHMSSPRGQDFSQRQTDLLDYKVVPPWGADIHTTGMGLVFTHLITATNRPQAHRECQNHSKEAPPPACLSFTHVFVQLASAFFLVALVFSSLQSPFGICVLTLISSYMSVALWSCLDFYSHPSWAIQSQMDSYKFVCSHMALECVLNVLSDRSWYSVHLTWWWRQICYNSSCGEHEWLRHISQNSNHFTVYDVKPWTRVQQSLRYWGLE